jgi:hypothetical protein
MGAQADLKPGALHFRLNFLQIPRTPTKEN